MRNFYTLAFRNLLARKGRTLLTTLGITLGVAAMVSVGITRASAAQSLVTVFEEATGKADLVIEEAVGSAGSRPTFDASLVERVARVHGVSRALPLLQLITVPATQIGEWESPMVVATASGTMVYGLDPVASEEIGHYRLVAGQDLDPERGGRNSILLTQSYAETLELDIGDDLALVAPDGTIRFTITGLIAREGLGQLNRGEVGITTLDVAQRSFGHHGEISQIDVVAEPGVELDSLQTQLQRVLGDRYQVIRPASKGALVDQILQNLLVGLGFISFITLFVGAFLIYNTFAMTIVERTRELGLLRSLGAGRGQITVLVLIEAFLLGAIGSGMGALLGIGFALGMRTSVSGLINTELQGLDLPPPVILGGVGMGMVVTLISALIPAGRGGRVAPVVAMRPQADRRPGYVSPWQLAVGTVITVICGAILARYSFNPRGISFQAIYVCWLGCLLGIVLLIPASINFWQRLLAPVAGRAYGMAGQLGGRNLARAPGRTGLTAASLLVGLVMVVDIGAFTASSIKMVDDFIVNTITGDLYVYAPQPMRPQVGQNLLAIPGVRFIAPISFLQTTMLFGNPSPGTVAISVTSIEPEKYLGDDVKLNFADEGGSAEVAMIRLGQGNAVLISTVLRERHGLDVGDTVRLRTARGTAAFTVAGIVLDYSSQGDAMIISRRDQHFYFGSDRVSIYNVRITDEWPAEVVRQRILDRLGDRYHLRVETNAEYRSRIEAYTAQFYQITDVMTLISVIVAVLGVINTLMMNVLERRREIGMVRGVGMTRVQILTMILAEASATGALGGLLGLVVGLAASRMFINAANALSGFEMPYVFPIQALGTGLVIALIIPPLAGLYPAWRAARVSVIDALRQE